MFQVGLLHYFVDFRSLLFTSSHILYLPTWPGRAEATWWRKSLSSSLYHDGRLHFLVSIDSACAFFSTVESLSFLRYRHGEDPVNFFFIIWFWEVCTAPLLSNAVSLPTCKERVKEHEEISSPLLTSLRVSRHFCRAAATLGSLSGSAHWLCQCGGSNGS